MVQKPKTKNVIGKTELVRIINENLQKDPLYRKNPINGIQIGKVVDKFLEEVEKALVKGNQISLKGYFTLKTMETKARVGTNPATKKKINIPKGRRISFKPSANLKSKLKTNSGKK